MQFTWMDYQQNQAPIVEAWIDEEAKKYTGCDEGWDEYFNYWKHDPDTIIGENFWGKIILQEQTPVAIIAIGREEQTFLISEFIVAPKRRGMGLGSAILQDLINNDIRIIGQPMKFVEACIFPSNIASQKAFQNAGFSFSYEHDDGDAWYYKLIKE